MVEASWEKLGVVRVFDIQVGRVVAVALTAFRRKGLIVLYLLSKAVLMVNAALLRATI